MKVQTFVENYKSKNFMNTRQGADEKVEWIRKELEIKTYIPFREKRQIAEMIVGQYTDEVDGIKKHDSIAAYVGFVTAMIASHTVLKFSDNPVADYDLLSDSGLLPQIVSEFQQDYNECGIILKMALAMELEYNNTNVLIGHFLDGVLKKLDGLSGMLGRINLNEIFKDENMVKIVGLLNKSK